MAKMVFYQDRETRKISRIPASEIPPGATEVRMEGYEEPVWVSTSDAYGTLMDDEDFSSDVQDALIQIQTAFAEHRSLTTEQWGQWIRKQEDSDLVLALWQRAAELYCEIVDDSSLTQAQRAELYSLLDRLVNRSPAVESSQFEIRHLSHATAKAVAERFHGRS